MSSRLVAVAFDVEDPAPTAALWAAVLGRVVVEEPGGVLVPGDERQVGLRFTAARTPRREWNRLHLHVTSASVDDQRRTVDVVLGHGGRRRGTAPLPWGDDLYLADPGGDEFCVIEPGNRFLDGCGPLGEVTCEGTPAAGRFWAEALGWHVVWDQDAQLAIQSPAGGTKLSWDGPAESEARGWNRQRFDLVTDDPDPELDRLLALGATRVGADLRDPDGSAFTLRSAASA